MLEFIVIMLALSAMMRNRAQTRGLLRGIFLSLAVFYGIQIGIPIILYAGVYCIPLILIIWVVMNIAVPFVKGFMSSFQKGR